MKFLKISILIIGLVWILGSLSEEASAQNNTELWATSVEGENADFWTTGQEIWREDAFFQKVHGQVGCLSSNWAAQAGYVSYTVETPETENLMLNVRYSKHTPTTTIDVQVDGEYRNTFTVLSTGSWNTFTWSEQIDLGPVASGQHSISFHTTGQTYCSFEIDRITMTVPWELVWEATAASTATTGRFMWRSNATLGGALGQYGCTIYWGAQAGYVEYENLDIPTADEVYMSIRYSRDNFLNAPIEVYLNNEHVSSVLLSSTGDWNQFDVHELNLGPVEGGNYTLRLETPGVSWCVADIDTIGLSLYPN